jgi:flagellar basal body-associated protein FliL
MAQQQHSSRSILIITIIVAVVLIIVIWPLSMIGKGSVTTAAGDEPEVRIQPVAKAGTGESRCGQERRQAARWSHCL